VGVCFAQMPLRVHAGVGITPLGFSHASRSSLMRASANSLAVGTLPGKFHVSSTGAANYRIPISVPPGTGGMAPKLSIVYNSQQKNGLLGMGFSLQGLTEITRGPQNKAQNGTIHGVDFSDADRFMLNGEQLVATKGAYGQDGTEYQTYDYNGTKIISHGRSGNGPASFTVYTKDGQIAEYAATSDSELKAHVVNPNGSLVDGNTVKTWALDKIQDRAGNYLTISYFKDEASGVFHPTEIDYTGNKTAGVTSYNRIQFVYQARDDVHTSWHAGSKTTVNKLLSDIVVYNGKTKTYDYKLKYELSPNTSRSRLVGLQLCDGSNHCLPATTFDWQTNQEGWEKVSQYDTPTWIMRPWPNSPGDKDNGVRFLDVTGNGLADMVQYGAWGSANTWLHTGAGWQKTSNFILPTWIRRPYSGDEIDNGLRFIDFNGDGLQDIVVNNPWEKSAWINTGKKWIADGHYIPPVWIMRSWPIFPGDMDNGVRFLDVTGNGLPDMLQYGAWDGAHTWLNTGTGWKKTSNFILPTWIMRRYSENAIDNGLRFMDLNGDGLQDIVINNPWEKNAWINTGTKWVSNSNYIPPTWIMRPWPTSAGEKDNGVRFIDVTGNGLPDMLQYGAWEGPRTWINTGDGWLKTSNYKLPTWITRPYSGDEVDNGLRFIDLNGDGIVDLVLSNPWDKHMAWINDRGQWRKHTNYALPTWIMRPYSGIPEVDNGFRFVDLNGSGLPGFVVHNPWNKPLAYVNKAKKLPDMLIGITNGLGEKTSIDYEPLSGTYVKVYSQEKNADGTLDSHYPNPQFDGPMYVVYQTASSTGTNDPQTLNELAQRNGLTAYDPPQSPYSTIPKNTDASTPQHITTYHYTGSRMNRLGWGFLGFHKVQITDDSTGITNTTIYSQDGDNHLAHHPLETDTSTSSGQLLSSKTFQWKVVLHGSSALNQHYYQVYAAQTTQKSYDLNSHQLLSTQVVNTHQDSYGNILELQKRVTDTTGTYTTNSENTYSNDPNTWLIGALTKSVVTKTNPDGNAITRTSQFSYDKQGFLQQTILEPSDPNLSVTKTYQRDAFGNVVSTTTSWQDPISQDKQSSTTKVSYDPLGRFVLSKTNALGQTISQTMSPQFGKPLSSTDLNGLVTTYYYDGFGRLLETDHPDGTVTKTSYAWSNPAASQISQNRLNAAVSSSTLTNYSVLQTVISPNPKQVMVGMGMTAQPIKTVYQVSTQTFNKADQPISGMNTKYYDDLNRQIATTTQNFDGRVIWKDTFYDDLGRVIQQSVPFFAGTDPKDILYTRFTYDALGRVTDTINPDNSKIHMDYEGNTTVTTNPLGQKTSKTINALGKIVKSMDSAGHVTLYSYDPYGNLTGMKDSQGNLSSIAYDKLGRKIAISDPDKGHWSYTYNPIGELIKQTDAKGQVTTFKYDVLGRLIERTDHAGTQEAATSTWQYDTAKNGLGLLAKVNGVSNVSGGDANASDLIQAEKNGLVNYQRTIAYDSLSRPISSTVNLNGQSYTTSKTYNSSGQVDQTESPNGLITQNVYNTLGFVIKVLNAKTQAVYWQLNQMDAQGHITSFTRSNGLVTTKTYDPATDFLVQIQTAPSEALALQQQLLPQTQAATKKTNQAYRRANQREQMQHHQSLNATAMTAIQDLNFTYDALGNIKTRINAVTTRDNTYQYDDLNRLTHWNQNGTDHAYAYDDLGNITSKWDVGTYHYAQTNPDGSKVGPHAVTGITDSAGKTIATFTYDPNGAQTDGLFQGKLRHITYTSFDKPLQINTQDAVTKKEKAQIQFYYNAERQRFERIDTNQETGEVTTTLYLGSYELVVHNLNGKLTTEEKNYVGNTLLVHTIQSDKTTQDKTYEILTDNLGSTSAITDETGSVVQRFEYTPFGEQIRIKPSQGSSFSILTHRGFTGHEELESVNLIHMTGRLYDPVLGRFLSADPKIQDPTNSQSLNRYSYCLNNPLAYTDPTGFSWFSDLIHDIGHAIQDVLNNQYVEIAIQVGINAVLPGWGAAIASAVWQAELTLINGGSVEDAFKNGAFSFAGSMISMGGNHFFGSVPHLDSIKWEEKGLAEGLAGGGLKVVEGGSFSDGFLATATSALTSGEWDKIDDGGFLTSHLLTRASVSGIIGGTEASITGGNFTSGFKTSAYQELLSDTVGMMEYKKPFHPIKGHAYLLGRKLKVAGGLLPLIYPFAHTAWYIYLGNGNYKSVGLRPDNDKLIGPADFDNDSPNMITNSNTGVKHLDMRQYVIMKVPGMGDDFNAAKMNEAYQHVRQTWDHGAKYNPSAPNYNVVSHNCHDASYAVLQEYRKLMGE